MRGGFCNISEKSGAPLEWRMAEDGMHMISKLDYYSDNRGVITMTPEGKQDLRRIQVVRGGVRVMQGEQTWLEFERVE